MQACDLNIIDLSERGEGIARLDSGQVVFVQGDVIPGDRVRAEPISDARARFRSLSIEESSENRRVPPCAHFGECGGCTLQAMRDEAQAALKEHQLHNVLERLAGLSSVDVLPMISCPETFRYRNRIRLEAFGRRGPIQFGYHPRGKRRKCIAVDDCHLASTAMNESARHTLQILRKHRITSRQVQAMELRESRSRGGILLHLISRERLGRAEQALIGGLHKPVRHVVLTVDPTMHLLRGDGVLIEELAGLHFAHPLNGFFQINNAQTEAMIGVVRQWIPKAGTRLLDLYCGVGTFSLPLASQFDQVVGYESSLLSVKAAEDNAARNRIDNCGFQVADLNETVPIKAADTILCDPPRSGLSPVLRSALCASLRPKQLIYISCNPSTFARDAAVLIQAGLRLMRVQPVDLFPQTLHCELIGEFRLI